MLASVSVLSARKFPSMSVASWIFVTWSRPCASDRKASERSQTHFTGRFSRFEAASTAASSP